MSSGPDDVPQRRRKPAAIRRREIADVAADLFARQGFGVSTRTISDVLGVTQAALYRHFRSKDELIEEVFRLRYLDEKPSNFAAILAQREGPLRERLAAAYMEFFAGISETSLKLFQRAAQDGLELIERYSPHLDERILLPVLTELRLAAGLPSIKVSPPDSEERELVLMLHSCVVFLAIRKFVYQVDLRERETDIIQQHVQVWLDGALLLMQEKGRGPATVDDEEFKGKPGFTECS